MPKFLRRMGERMWSRDRGFEGGNPPVARAVDVTDRFETCRGRITFVYGYNQQRKLHVEVQHSALPTPKVFDVAQLRDGTHSEAYLAEHMEPLLSALGVGREALRSQILWNAPRRRKRMSAEGGGATIVPFSAFGAASNPS